LEDVNVLRIKINKNKAQDRIQYGTSREQGNEPSGATKDWEFLEKLSDC
jgi:hypothetical protein